MSVNGDGGDAGRHARYEDENIRIRNYTDFLESDVQPHHSKTKDTNPLCGAF